MKTARLAWAAVCLCPFVVSAAVEPPPAKAGDAEQAIRELTASFARAFERGDAVAIAALYTEDAEAVTAEGDAIQGRAALAAHYKERLADGAPAKFSITIESIKMPAPGVARVIGRSSVTPTAGETPVDSRFSSIDVLQNGRWLIAGVREIADKEPARYERLQQLEWLVGDWVEESETAVVFTSVAWTENKSFLLRTFNVRAAGKPALTGTQRIGWDPLTKQIKSWVFDDQGGYGEGLWMRKGDQWIIKATGVRSDGRVATATQVLTRISDDELRWKSIDRTRGDEISTDIDEVLMVRKPPAPKK